MMLTYRIHVIGKVQGVFFRQTTKDVASTLGITGTVSNQEDDSVLILASGTKEQLDELVKWCRHGPPKAHVADVVVTELPAQDFQSFTITRS